MKNDNFSKTHRIGEPKKMSNNKKCDICGRDFDEAKAGYIVVIASHVNDRYESTTIHCCPYCMAAFKNIASIIKDGNRNTESSIDG